MWDDAKVDGFLTDLTENVNIYVNYDGRFRRQIRQIRQSVKLTDVKGFLHLT